MVTEGISIRPKALLLDRIAAVRAVEMATERTPTEEAALPLFRRLTRGDALIAASMLDKAVARLVKRYAAVADHDVARFSGHSLRAGSLTEAASHGATIFKMQEVIRHRTVQVLSARLTVPRSCGGAVPVGMRPRAGCVRVLPR